MKQRHNLSLAGQTFRVISRDVRRALNTSARASFTVATNQAAQVPPEGMVTYGFGFADAAGGTVYRDWFLGYIDKVVSVDQQHTKVFCRDLASVLTYNLPMSLRNVTLRQVLQEVTRITGLPFMLPDASYCDNKAAHFCNLGSGLQVIESLAKVFQIPQYQWQQLTNGKIYVGAYQDAPWYKKSARFPENLFSKQQADRTARIAPMPAIRPGITLNGKRIHAVTLQEDMLIKWK